jgi:arylsulfatase A-like enzyme
METFDGYNVILVNLDGFRKDKIDLCPTLKSLKEQSYFCENMFTVAPYTFASLHAIFSGMFPSRNGVNAYYNIFKFKKNEITTISEVMKENGYYTSCDIISDSVLPNKGFDEWNVFDEKSVDFNSRHREIIKKLSNKKKFFLFLHFTETHKHLVREIVQKYKQEENDDKFFSSQKENNIRYNSFLPSCDNYVSSILKTIEECGISQKTIVIFFADHGTSIGEKKGEKFYGVYTYDYTIKIFCIIKIPNSEHKITKKQCSTLDIFPTITDLTGIKLDNRFNTLQGKSVIPLFENNESKEREVFVETGGLYGPWPSSKKHNVFCIRSNEKKLIYNDSPNTWEFYDLKKDPDEINNIYNDKSADIIKMKERIMFYLNENKINTKLTPKF